MKTPRGTSESSTTSDNTAEFIEIVKKYDVVYNTHNQDYKNVEIKMKVWSQIAEEIGLSVDASKRKWKNLRDSYTKYLRSFRVGTKTSKKYQYWAHAEHMDFLKPYQGPGRNSNNAKGNDNDDDTECDLGYQVLTKASEEDIKSVNALNSNISPIEGGALTALRAANASTSNVNTVPNNVLVPSLPTVQLPPPPLACKPIIPPITTSSASLSSGVQSTHIFPLPSLMSTSTKNSVLPIPTTSTASNVGCLIIEPFAAPDNLKKELNLPSLGVLHSISSSTVTSNSRTNPPLVTKIRRVQPSTKPSTNTNSSAASTHISAVAVSTAGTHPPPPKSRKVPDSRWPDLDINTVLQAARELDANTLFFLSLARTVRTMPTKYQSIAKMRCMKLISDIELELDNTNGDSLRSDSPQTAGEAVGSSDLGTEHFVYVMSPSRVESMIDISSDEEAAQNTN